MDEDNLNDVILVEDTDDENSKASNSSLGTRPLMSLLERLIYSDSESNTVLTNTQIMYILNKEFNIDVKKLHELEVDIYIDIVKKFLGDWPQWDVFDQEINKVKEKTAHTEIKKILEQRYKHLKEYLMSIIKIAKPLAKSCLKKLNATSPDKTKEVGDAVLEIHCTRKMLNKLIYSQPCQTENNSIFNLVDFEVDKLNPALPYYTFPSILHWYGVHLSIKLPYFQYTRNTSHRLSHMLVNEANGPRQLNKELDTSVYMKDSKSITNSVPISYITTLLDKILSIYKDKIEYDMIQEIFEVVKSDLAINSMTVEVPGTFKQYSNKYPYVRKLCTEVDTKQTSQNNYFIEESITPIQEWHIGKFTNVAYPTKLFRRKVTNLRAWINLECGECKQKFNGAEFLTMLRDHFKVYHMNEPDWTCTNCKKSFSMAQLTDVGWRHVC